MRILILANNDVGLYKFRKELLCELIAAGNELYAALPGGEYIADLEKIGVRHIHTQIDRRGINPLKDIKLIVRYFRIMLDLKPELVITYTVKPNVYGSLASRLLGIEYAVNVTGLGSAFQQDNFVKRLVCFLYKTGCRDAKLAFFENEENRRVFVENKLIKPEQAYMLNGAGVSLTDYNFAQYPGEEEPINFLFIGRVMKEKGIEELFAAARKMKKEYPAVSFSIVGPMEDEYGALIAALEAEAVIKYHGYQRDVKPFIEKCHCFVLPSYHEGMANTLLEAAAMGRPLITSRIHGCMEAVEEGKNGYLVERGDAEQLLTVLHKFIKADYGQKKEMAKMSRALAEAKFDRRRLVEQTIAALLR